LGDVILMSLQQDEFDQSRTEVRIDTSGSLADDQSAIVIRIRLEHSAGFDDRSDGGLLEPLNFISQILDLDSLFLNNPQQRKDQR
jgi:hypothetical protein